jgi:hypothetical protein
VSAAGGWQCLTGLAAHAAQRSGGARAAAAVMACAMVAGFFAIGLPVAAEADRPLIVAGVALAGAAAATGLGMAVGAASALARSPQLAMLATAPVGRGQLTLSAMAGVTGSATLLGLLAAWAGALPMLVAGGGSRQVSRLAHATALTGVVGAGGDRMVRWTAAGSPPLVARFDGLTADRLGAGPLPLRLRLRIALTAAPRAGDALPEQPIHVAAGKPGAAAPLARPLGNPWGSEGLRLIIPRERLGGGGALEVRVGTTVPGLSVGALRNGIRVELVPGTLAGSYVRAALELIPALVLIALVAAAASTVCSRGVSLMAGVTAAIALGLAPLAREALADLPPPGESLPWADVGWSALSHLPAVAICVTVAWWLVRRRDW